MINRKYQYLPGLPRTPNEDDERIGQAFLLRSVMLNRQSVQETTAFPHLNSWRTQTSYVRTNCVFGSNTKPADADCRKRLGYSAQISQWWDFRGLRMFYDGPTFHLNSITNRHNCRIWGSQQQNKIWSIKRETPKVNVWRGMMTHHTTGMLCCGKEPCLDMLEHYAVPQLPRDAWLSRIQPPTVREYHPSGFK
jgi:hypothetical protein